MTYEEEWRELCITCFRYLDVKSLDEILEMTLEEIGLRLEAYRYKRIDIEHDMHWQAYLNLRVNQKREVNNGKAYEYVYADFNDFFNRTEVENRMLGVTTPKTVEELEVEKRMDNIDWLILQANKEGDE